MPKFVEPVKSHNELNPKLWKGERLDPKVRDSLLKIAEVFYKFLDISAPVQDIRMYGSQTNYNYTSHSDIDLHLVFDFKSIECDEPIEDLIDAKRKLWAEQHTIDIRGIPVEPYAEDLDAEMHSACYSLVKDSWLAHPRKAKITYNRSKVQRAVTVWQHLMDTAIRAGDPKLAKHLQKLLGRYRKLGLRAQGEFGVPNLVFKSLRNAGTLDRLSQAINSMQDRDLSLD